MPSLTIRPASMKIPDAPELGELNFPGFLLKPGRMALLSGESGSGKSTLLRWLHVHPGSFCLDDLALQSLFIEQFYDRLVFPYQPVWWNVALPLYRDRHIRRAAALRAAELRLLEFKLNLDLRKFPGPLSGGEKHLLLLARASLSPHPMILIDEPATAVDSARAELMWGLLRRLITEHEKWLIITSHTGVPADTVGDAVTFEGFRGYKLSICECLLCPAKKEVLE